MFSGVNIEHLIWPVISRRRRAQSNKNLHLVSKYRQKQVHSYFDIIVFSHIGVISDHSMLHYGI